MRNGCYYFPDKNDDEYVDYFVSGMHRSFWDRDYKTIKQNLWLLTKAVVSFGWENTEEVDHGRTVIFLKKMVTAAWRCKEYMEREKYTHPSFHLKWEENPFYQRPTDQDHEYNDRNKPYLMHEGKIQHLSVAEVRDFTLAIDHFFEQLNVLDWLALLDKWEEYSRKVESIASEGWDEHPLCTYDELRRLIEITYLGDSFYYNHPVEDGLVHNGHFFDADYVITKLDATNTGVYNPLEQINWIFGDYTVYELKEEIDYWFDCAIDETKIWNKAEPGKLIDFHDWIICLYEAGWLLLQGEEVPAKWLDPHLFEHFDLPKESLTQNPQTNLLSLKQRANSTRTLSILYRRTGIGFLRDQLGEVLSYALRTSKNPYSSYEDKRNLLKKIVEILDVINQRNCLSKKHLDLEVSKISPAEPSP
ncbi:hypothetical protein [Sphingobacterium pedocola]|nr:hypothetical protein [Sphingobacterium pedocola]